MGNRNLSTTALVSALKKKLPMVKPERALELYKARIIKLPEWQYEHCVWLKGIIKRFPGKTISATLSAFMSQRSRIANNTKSKRRRAGVYKKVKQGKQPFNESGLSDKSLSHTQYFSQYFVPSTAMEVQCDVEDCTARKVIYGMWTSDAMDLPVITMVDMHHNVRD